MIDEYMIVTPWRDNHVFVNHQAEYSECSNFYARKVAGMAFWITTNMSKSKNTKNSPKPAPKTSTEAKDLKKVSLHVNEFGEIVRDVKTEDINAFLDENVPDKKFLESDESMK